MTCHFSILKVRFAFWAFSSKTGNTRVTHRVKMMTRWPGDPDVKDDPNYSLTQWPSSMFVAHTRAFIRGNGTSRGNMCGNDSCCSHSSYSHGIIPVPTHSQSKISLPFPFPFPFCSGISIPTSSLHSRPHCQQRLYNCTTWNLRWFRASSWDGIENGNCDVGMGIYLCLVYLCARKFPDAWTLNSVYSQ